MGLVIPGIFDSDFMPPYADAAEDDKLLLCKYELCKLLCDDEINGVVYKCDDTVVDGLLSCDELDDTAVVEDELDGDCMSYFDGELTFDAAACMLASGDGSAYGGCDE